MPKKESKQQFVIQLDSELHAKLKELARIRDQPLSEIIVEWIKAGWEAAPDKDQATEIAKRISEARATPTTKPPAKKPSKKPSKPSDEAQLEAA